VPSFELQFDPSEIETLAARFSYEDDGNARAAGHSARRRGFYTREEFLTVCEWKTKRSRPKVAVNSEEAVQRATTVSLDRAGDEKQRMEALTSLAGVGVPTGSALLHFADPGKYPILDVRAMSSLGCRPRTTYPVEFWLDYLDVCRTLAREHGVAIRTLDKALWQRSKER
jgi:hypothetical protein